MKKRTNLVTVLVAFVALTIIAPAVPAKAGTAEAAPVVRQEKHAVWQVLFAGRVGDDLSTDRKQADDVAAFLDRQLARILPLEAEERKNFYLTFGELYREYADVLDDAADVAHETLSLCSDRQPHCLKPLGNGIGKVVAQTARFQGRLQDIERKAESDGDRIARIIETRTALQAVLQEIQDRLDRLDSRGHGDRSHDDETERTKLHREYDLRQRDLFSLPEADEDLLRHFRVAAEQARQEVAWLEVKNDEYEALLEAVSMTAEPGFSSSKATAVTRGLARFYDAGLQRLQRRIDIIDRKADSVARAGTMRQLDRSQEMREAYDLLRDRYRGQMSRYRIRAADYAAD